MIRCLVPAFGGLRYMRRKVLAAALLVMVSALPAHAAGDAPPQIDPDVLTEGFLAAHPDLR
jgi:hypothetical protein